MPGVDLFCFTDDEKLNSDQYRIVYSPDIFGNARKTSRLFKISPHLFLHEYEYVIWHDASIQFIDIQIIDMLVEKAGNFGIALFKHWSRNCIYEEADWCLTNKKESPHKIERLISMLREENYPSKNGLIAGGLIARKNNEEEVIKFNNEWWLIYSEFSQRDQLSFNYVAWKNKKKFFAFEPRYNE